MRVATLTTWNENGYAPLGDELGCQSLMQVATCTHKYVNGPHWLVNEFVCHWCHEPE